MKSTYLHLKALATATLVAGLFCAASTAHALTINLTPASGAVLFGNETSEADIISIINASAYAPLTQLYKATRADGSESGAFAGNYSTSFADTILPNSEALITWDGPASINSNPVYAFIRDGSATNYNWYLFNISGWNGTDSIQYSGFFAGQNISHVAIYGNNSSRVPDGGSTVVFLGLATAAMGMFYRRFGKSKS